MVLPVIVPWTPAKVAVMITFELGPTAVSSPVVLTVAHEVELDQVAELLTIFVPLLKVAVAVNCLGAPTATEKVLAPACVTVSEFGWLTKKPVQPTPAANRERAAKPATSDSFRLELSIVKTPERTT